MDKNRIKAHQNISCERHSRPHYSLSQNDEHKCFFYCEPLTAGTLKAHMGLKQKTHTSGTPCALILPKESQANSKDALKNGSGGNVMSHTQELCRLHEGHKRPWLSERMSWSSHQNFSVRGFVKTTHLTAVWRTKHVKTEYRWGKSQRTVRA